MGFERSWSGMRKYLETDMLAPCLRGRIRYDCTAYPQANYSSRMFLLWVDGDRVQRFCIEEACRWFVETGRILWEKYEPIGARWQGFWRLLQEMPPSVRTAYTDEEFCDALARYRRQEIRSSACSDDPMVVMFALLDRRLGKRTWQDISLRGKPAWLKKIHLLRGSAEGWTDTHQPEEKETQL